MKNFARLTIFTLSLILALSSVSFAQKASEKSWDVFWTKFTAAIKNKDRKAIKAMAAADFFDGGGGDTVSEWMKHTVDKNKLWGELYKTVKKGAKKYKSDDGKPWKVTKDDSLLFVYKDKRWQFYGVMGD